MKKSISVLKNYFKTGDKPTQQQFYDFLESYVHLDSTIFASQVEGLETALQTLQALGINDVIGLQTALNDLNTAITTLAVADVSGLQVILDALAVVAIGDVSGLQAVLDGLATRGISDITGLNDALNNKVDKVTGFGLSENDFSDYYVELISSMGTAISALNYEAIVTVTTASKTLALTDAPRKRIIFTGATANSLIVPLDASVAWYTGTKINGTVKGNGAVTISGAGITFIGNTLTFPKGESFSLVNTGLNEWTVEGNAPASGAKKPYAVYLNTSTGNDLTGAIEDKSKPFLTMTALINAISAYKGFEWEIVISGTVLEIDMPVMPVMYLVFNADDRYLYNFNFNTVRSGVNFIYENYTASTANYHFKNGNISLKSNNVAVRQLSYVNGTSYVSFSGVINVIDWANNGANGWTMCMPRANLTINEYIKRTSESQLQVNDPIYLRIKKVTYIGFGGGFLNSINANMSRITLDLIYCSANLDIELIVGNPSPNLDLELKSIDIKGQCSIFVGIGRLFLNELTCTSLVTFLEFREAYFITGKVISDVALKLARATNKTINNLECKIAGTSNFWGTTITIDNCRLTVVDHIVRGYTVNPKLVIFKGNNIIKQLNTTTPLIIGDATNLYNIDLQGEVITLKESTLVDGFGTVNKNVSEQGEKNFKAYPNTRNDGQIPTNRVLGTDASGNLKMYSIATAPAPFLEVLIPDSTLPSTTTNFTLRGAFFTPSMTVVIAGQTVNYVTFIDDNLVKANVTTGATEGLFAVTLNNGIQAVYQNALSIVLGTVFKPLSTEWTEITGAIDLSKDEYAKTSTYNSVGSAVWNRILDNTKNYSVRVQFERTQLGAYAQGLGAPFYFLYLQNVSDSVNRFFLGHKNNSGDLGISVDSAINGNNTAVYGAGATFDEKLTDLTTMVFELRKIGSTMYFYKNNVLFYTYTDPIAQNLKLKLVVKFYDLKNIKYIELAS